MQHFNEYKLGQYIDFYAKNFNANKYVIKGLTNFKSENYTYTDGKYLRLHMNILDDVKKIKFSAFISAIFNNKQTINIFVNNKKMYSNVLNSETVVEFEFERQDNGLTEIVFEMPDATTSIYEINGLDDRRKLGIGINHIKIILF